MSYVCPFLSSNGNKNCIENSCIFYDNDSDYLCKILKACDDIAYISKNTPEAIDFNPAEMSKDMNLNSLKKYSK